MVTQCGFFDSVNKDRLYRAEDMTKPYELLVSNGVFATPNETPSDFLQVLANANDDMTVTIKPGRGIFKDKWFINDSDLILTIDTSEVVLNRIDSIIVKIDTSKSVRAGTIEIKKGVASSTPTAPVMERSTHVYEYRLADIRINAGVTKIVQANITDQRGSSDCPWITSLIKQVDTSTLFKQYQDANQTFLDESEVQFAEWFAQLKETVATQTLIRTFTSYYVTQVQDETVIPINITQFNNELDILQVHINGLMMVEDVDYTIESVPASQITLTRPLDKGQGVAFTVYKSVDGSEAETVLGQIEELQTILDASKLTNDTGGVKLSLVSGDLLARFKELGKGFHTVLAGNTVTSTPIAGQYWRCFGHITDVPYGWIIAINGSGRAWINFANGETTWIGWKELTNYPPITDENGNVKINVFSGDDVLSAFVSAGVGFHTMYAQNGALNMPKTGAFRLMGQMNVVGYGWLMAFQADGSVYANYIDANVWQGWKVLHEAKPELLYFSENGAYPNPNYVITPTKPLSQCQHGWELMFTRYQDGALMNDIQTFHIPKMSPLGDYWDAGNVTIPLAFVGDTLEWAYKVFAVSDTQLISDASNSVGVNRNFAIKAIYEY